MPWDYILGGASGAGIALILGILFAKQFIEKLVETKFSLKLEEFRSEQNSKLETLRGEQNTKLEAVRADLNRRLEFDKSDLSVWADLRKNILAEMWKAHRDIVKQMTEVILNVQELQWNQKAPQLKPAIDEYRRLIHGQIDLISPEALNICQQFLEDAYQILQGDLEPQDAILLKGTRGKLYAYAAKLYGLEDMMPWMVRNSSLKSPDVNGGESEKRRIDE
jgi:hypothetical protein